jgi:16S rRNA (cytosine967-C5)-methyltransferase
MTPSARLEAAIEILGALETTALPADRFIRDWFRRRRYAGSKDRAAVAERVFDILRHRGSYAWRMRSAAPRSLAMASLLRDGESAESIQALFRGESYGPAALSEEERARLLPPPEGEPPLAARGEFPEWLEPELLRAFGADLLDEMVALQSRASIDLRVNSLKAERTDVLSALGNEGFDAQQTPFAPFGIRIAAGAGAAALGRSKLFEAGAFEFQDEAAQIAALLVGAKPGMRALDLAAGAGGKSLALAAAMRNQGEIVAGDIDAGRLAQIGPRAERAGVTIILPRPGAAGEVFDRVLVDAPCSGTGTWRRQPELRWRLTPERLAALQKTQDSLLEDGARHTRPGGRLISATCSILPSENEDRIAVFLARHPDFAIRPAREVWAESVGTDPPPGLGDIFRATPLKDGMDGFFTAVLERHA